MELIARIAIRRHEMGEAGGEGLSRHASNRSLAVFRVSGKSPERAMKLLCAEMAKQDKQIMVLSLAGTESTERTKNICEAALSQGHRLATPVVFCGGDPSQLFDRGSVYRDSLNWFPSIHAFIATFESDNRHANNHAG